MNNICLKIILMLLMFWPNKFVCHNYMGESPIFDHGTVETFSSNIENGNGFENIDSMGVPKPTKYHPVMKSTMDLPPWNFVKPTSPTSSKISLMKTYFDPVTKQPFRYIMRKKTELDDDDSILNTASKLFNQFIWPQEYGASEQEYNRNFRKIKRYTSPDISVKHVHKREVSENDKLVEIGDENELRWTPIFQIKNDSAYGNKVAKYINEKQQAERKKERDSQLGYEFHENQSKFAFQLEKTDGNKASVIEKLPLEASEMKETDVGVDKKDNSSFRKWKLNEYNLNLNDSGILTAQEQNDETDDSDGTESSDFGLMESLKIVHQLLIRCKRKAKFYDKSKHFISSIQSCLQISVLKAFDRMLLSQEIPLSDNIRLVREVRTSLIVNGSQELNSSAKDLKGPRDFIAAVCERLFRILQSHSLQIKLWQSPDQVVEGRRRHHYRKAFPMMVAGYMMLSAFLVPMGFQFMAMIGGKALLLSKMALMMAMLGGFRKLLSPELPVYHPPPSYDFHGNNGWHHRSTHEPMTLAYSKNNNNNYAGYNNLQRQLQQKETYWIDPKSYNVLK